LKYEAVDRILWLTGFRKGTVGPVLGLLTFKSLLVTIRTTKFTIQESYTVITWNLCFFMDLRKKEQNLPYKTLKDRLL